MKARIQQGNSARESKPRKTTRGIAPTVEEIRQYIGADSLSYLSLEGMKKACHDGEKTTYCTACYTGKYPTNIVDVEEILPATIRP